MEGLKRIELIPDTLGFDYTATSETHWPNSIIDTRYNCHVSPYSPEWMVWYDFSMHRLYSNIDLKTKSWKD